MKYRIVIPTYHEEKNMKKIIRNWWHGYLGDIKIIVVDDTNNHIEQNGTVMKICEDINYIDYIGNFRRRGYGRSLKSGMIHAFRTGADKIIIMDADHPMKNIQTIIDGLNHHDVMIGIEKDSNRERKITKWLLDRFFNTKKIQHPTCGFMGFNSDSIKLLGLSGVDFWDVKSEYDFIHVEFLLTCIENKLSIGQFVFTDHEGGISYPLKRKLIWLHDYSRVVFKKILDILLLPLRMINWDYF